MNEIACGNILKMKNELSDVVKYQLPIGDTLIEMNDLIGKKLKIEFTGTINCIASGEEIKKSYNSGYSYKSLMTLAQCDICIVKPELCHYDQGTCREPEWGKKHCLQPHIIYLSYSSNLKIGITRKVNIPHRWIDQGAIRATPILEVHSRLDAGLIEKEISRQMADKTNWRKMLTLSKEEIAELDFETIFSVKEELYEVVEHLMDDLDAIDLDEEIIEINYPIDGPAPKVKSLNLDKDPTIEGTLLGIKGQYLIFDIGVINMRKYQGYNLKFSA